MNQEQSSNTPAYWASIIVETEEGILRSVLPDGFPSVSKEAVKQNIQRWVVHIRQDEIEAIIREIDKRHQDASYKLTIERIVELLHERSVSLKL
jgi:hypothetical protein